MLIAGLGNPGREYEFTRHNAGFRAADIVASKFRAQLNNKTRSSLFGFFTFRNEQHILLKPQTYMNLSGEAVSEILIEHDIPPEQLLVLVDDINLPLGRVRLRATGSDGGHNGLKSIISHTGKSFWRLRIGVGQPVNNDESEHEQLVSHVLGGINDEEQVILEQILSEVPDIVAMWLMGMGMQAMTKYNCRNFTSENSINNK